jgi:hypothetical protein
MVSFDHLTDIHGFLILAGKCHESIGAGHLTDPLFNSGL